MPKKHLKKWDIFYERLEQKEKCSNCGERAVENIVITAFILKRRSFESATVGQCQNCRKLRSLNRWFAGL